MSRAWRLGPGLVEEPVEPQAFAAAVDRLLEEITTARSQPAISQTASFAMRMRPSSSLTNRPSRMVEMMFSAAKAGVMSKS